MKLTRGLKFDLFKVILSEQDFIGYYNEKNDGIVKFLNGFIDLENLPSSDSRYENALQDAYQHLVNNNDWDIEYVFDERFNIINNNELFIEFLNFVLSPKVRINEDSIMKYYFIINPYLEKENLCLNIIDYDEDILPIYEVQKYDKDNTTAIGLKANNIPFFVDQNSGYRGVINYIPTVFPCFVLVPNKNWNDYSVVSEFYLHYYDNDKNHYYIDLVKIIHLDKTITHEVIPNSFLRLDSSFCSLGQEIQYYEKLKKIHSNELESILWALNDCAFFPDIQEQFENCTNFKNSLIRYDEAERLLRIAKYKVYGYDLKNLYSFKYNFKPKFAENEFSIDFKFNSNSLIPSRIFALIGKNGTGKTQLVTALPIDIYKKNDDNFMPKIPLFSKVIAVSYSAFDNFEIPKKTANFNYLYCGLKDEKGEYYTNKGLKLRFHHSWKKIKSQKRFEKWITILGNFIEIELINQFIVSDDSEDNVNIAAFNKINDTLSSGQSIILYIITEIVANIRYDSLLIYDEPETHLHPNAISQLINTIHELVIQFESYCIIATHSPLIIREILSKNVYIIERENSISTVRKPNVETFGENLTILTEEVFGNREVPKQFKKILKNLIEKGRNYEEIISTIESDNIPLNLNTKIYLKSLFDDKS